MAGLDDLEFETLPTVRLRGFDAMPTYSPELQDALDQAGDDALEIAVEDIPGLADGALPLLQTLDD